MKTILFVGNAKESGREIKRTIRSLKSEGVKTFGDLAVYLNFHNGLMSCRYNFSDLKLTPYGCFIFAEKRCVNGKSF